MARPLHLTRSIIITCKVTSGELTVCNTVRKGTVLYDEFPEGECDLETAQIWAPRRCEQLKVETESVYPELGFEIKAMWGTKKNSKPVEICRVKGGINNDC